MYHEYIWIYYVYRMCDNMNQVSVRVLGITFAPSLYMSQLATVR